MMPMRHRRVGRWLQELFFYASKGAPGKHRFKNTMRPTGRMEIFVSGRSGSGLTGTHVFEAPFSCNQSIDPTLLGDYNMDFFRLPTLPMFLKSDLGLSVSILYLFPILSVRAAMSRLIFSLVILAYIWVVWMLVCPSIWETVSIGTP